ncbi:MAG: flagellar hook-basal body complex protein FliE [Candidatus Tectomicrobia bacterium]|nr:flagellar hook-basal body complex protein FliE [Candidatus Tectomicrobia bacterium]
MQTSPLPTGQPLPGISAAPASARPAAGGRPAAPPFSTFLARAVEDVQRLQGQAEASMKALAVGDEKNVHETMLAIEKADLSFRLLLQVRNKLLGAYQEIMRLQV